MAIRYRLPTPNASVQRLLRGHVSTHDHVSVRVRCRARIHDHVRVRCRFRGRARGHVSIRNHARVYVVSEFVAVALLVSVLNR